MADQADVSAHLKARIEALKSRMQENQVTENEVRAFEKVANVISRESRSIGLASDDLIAVSFLARTPD
jgi:hypothetical protein